jgi:hypothetical protein
MGRPCTVCTHCDRDIIDRQLAAGNVPYRTIAARFGVGRTAITRHLESHVSKALALAAERKGINRAQQLQDRIDSNLADLARLRRKAERRGEYSVAISAVRERSRIDMLEAAMLGQLRAPTSQTLVQVHQASSAPVDHAEEVRRARLLVELEDNHALEQTAPALQVQNGNQAP